MKRPYRLSAKFIESVRTPGRYGDGRGGCGLSLMVKPSTVRNVLKSWRQRLPKDTKGIRELGLGTYPSVSLEQARNVARRNWQDATDGKELRTRPTPSIPTFAEALERVITIHSPSWKDGGRTEQSWRATMETYVFPRLGRETVDKVTTHDVMAVLTPIWSDKRTVAQKVRRRIGTVMKWAIAERFRQDNPAGDAIGEALPKGGHKESHHKSLPYAEVGPALKKIRETDYWLPAILCIEFQTLTGSRPTEAREAVWDEIDEIEKTWTIPASRTKKDRDHRVPLSWQALDVLQQARKFSGGTELVFLSRRNKALPGNAISSLLKEHQIPCVPHGMRSSLTDFVAEKTDATTEIRQHCIGHIEGSQSEKAYRRTDFYEKRREYMQHWADHVMP